MATHLNLDCPHCRTKGAGFEIAHQWAFRGDTTKAHLLAICGVCQKGVTILSKKNFLNSGSHENLLRSALTYPGNNYTIYEIHPSFVDDIPDGVPENIKHFYSQGLKNLYERNWDAAGAMFRKTLDVATKFLSPERKDLSLFKRINALVEDKLLTEAMGDWTHEVRLDGNDAVHDEEPETQEDACRSQKFCEAFLTYAFSLPTLVAESRDSRKIGAPED